MILTPDSYILSENICKKIIEEYKDKVSEVKNKIRKQKNYHETNPWSWIHKEIQNLITKNLGSEYILVERVTILKYDIGDFFEEHTDGKWNSSINISLSPTHFYGGVELCNKSEFDGGDFYIKGKKVDYKKGRLFTHGFDDLHGVTMVTRGTRWSIHFIIDKKVNNRLI